MKVMSTWIFVILTGYCHVGSQRGGVPTQVPTGWPGSEGGMGGAFSKWRNSIHSLGNNGSDVNLNILKFWPSIVTLVPNEEEFPRRCGQEDQAMKEARETPLASKGTPSINLGIMKVMSTWTSLIFTEYCHIGSQRRGVPAQVRARRPHNEGDMGDAFGKWRNSIN